MALVRRQAVTVGPDTVAALRRLHEARAIAELERADRLAPGSDCVPWSGALIAEVVVVKGLPGPAEASGGPACSGADGEAARKALEALGWDAGAVFFTLSRPEPGLEPGPRHDRLRAQIEAVDPRVIVALDAEAAQDVAACLGLTQLSPGRPARALGRRVVAVRGLEASLRDETAKRAAWGDLKAATPDGPVY